MSTKDDGIITLYMFGWQDMYSEIHLCNEKGLIETDPIYVSDKPNPREVREEDSWWHIIVRICTVSGAASISLTKNLRERTVVDWFLIKE